MAHAGIRTGSKPWAATKARGMEDELIERIDAHPKRRGHIARRCVSRHCKASLGMAEFRSARQGTYDTHPSL